MRRFRFSAILAAGLFFFTVLGCGGAKPNKVEGKVVFTNGQPVKAAMVTFVPKDKENGKSATGLTDDEGKFYLTTSNDGDGALPGEYKVVISQNKKAISQQPQQPSGDTREMYKKWLKENKDKKDKIPADDKGDIPDQYTVEEATPLKWTVPSSDSPTFKIPKRK
jgi:hypothetical protein